jgi:hypothetical protein
LSTLRTDANTGMFALEQEVVQRVKRLDVDWSSILERGFLLTIPDSLLAHQTTQRIDTDTVGSVFVSRE